MILATVILNIDGAGSWRELKRWFRDLARFYPLDLQFTLAAVIAGADDKSQVKARPIQKRFGQRPACSTPPDHFMRDALLVCDDQVKVFGTPTKRRLADQNDARASQCRRRVARPERGQALQVSNQLQG